MANAGKGYADYLRYIERKEKREIFRIKSAVLTHGRLSAVLRTAKGLVLGFGLANIMLARLGRGLSAYYALFVALSFVASVALINYERRHYNRKGLVNSAKIAARIFLVCLVVSLVALSYSGINGFIAVLAITMLFSSISYSME